MAFFGKIYKLDRTENFDGFVKSLNLPSDKADEFINSKSTQKIDQNGDEYVLTSFYDGKPIELKFKSGVEMEEKIGQNVVAKTTFTVDGNKITQVQKFDDGNTITFVREYSPDQLVVTITSNFWNGTAKRIYAGQ